MKIFLHGKLKRMFGPRFEIKTNVPAEALEALSLQLPGWPRDLLVDVVGYPTLELLCTPTDNDELHVVPSMRGGGGAFGKIILGAVLIGLMFIPGIGQGIQLALLSAGLGLILGGVMQLFTKAPTVSKSNDPPASKYIGSGKNTTAIGTYRNSAWGRNRIGGHWLSLQVDAKGIINAHFPTSPPA